MNSELVFWKKDPDEPGMVAAIDVSDCNGLIADLGFNSPNYEHVAFSGGLSRDRTFIHQIDGGNVHAKELPKRGEVIDEHRIWNLVYWDPLEGRVCASGEVQIDRSPLALGKFMQLAVTALNSRVGKTSNRAKCSDSSSCIRENLRPRDANCSEYCDRRKHCLGPGRLSFGLQSAPPNPTAFHGIPLCGARA